MVASSETVTRRVFRIRITYFRASGKYYTDCTEEREFRTSGPGGADVNMNDVAAWIRGLVQSGGQGAMPGLSVHSAGWEGHILLECDEGYPVMLPNLLREELVGLPPEGMARDDGLPG